MNSKTKSTLRKAICMMLVILSLYAYSIHQGIAAIALGDATAENNTNQNTDEIDVDSLYASDGAAYEKLDYSPLLSEEVSQRGQFEKHFQREDRAYEAVIYPYPVHYDANGTWEDIDNTLKEDKTSTGKTVYSNIANAFKVEFSASYTEKNELVSVTREGYSVGFGFIDFGSECDALIKNNRYDTPKDSTERDMQMRFPAQLTSEISYDEIAENKSLTYRITPVGVTELIKLDNIAAAENAFSVKLYVSSDLIPAVNDDGSIEFSDGKEIVFRLDAPYMYDANNEISTAISVAFELAEEQPDDSKTAYTYELLPDTEWLMSADRTYPVVIDPSVTTPFTSSAIQDAFVSSGYPDDVRQQSNPGQLNVGYGSSSGKNRTYVKFNTLPTLKSGDMVIQSNLYMYRTNGSSSGDKMALHKVTASWSSSSITWNNQPFTDDSSIIKALAFGKGQYAHTEWEITDLMKKWYSVPNSNYGIVVKCETEGSSNNYYQFYSSDNAYYTNAAPFANVIYVNSTGLENIWSYHSQSVGEAGTGYVNDYNGNLTFIHSDAVTIGGILPIAINHVYNTNDRLTDTGYGAGWRINYAQTLTSETIGDVQYYKHIDGDGTAHYYYHDSSLGWVNELDKETKLSVGTTQISIVDKENNKLVFNKSTGRLTNIRNSNYNSSDSKQIIITYNSSGQISKVKDGTDLSVNFTYTSGYLTKISCPDGTGVEFEYTPYSSYKNLHYIYYLGTNGTRTGEVSTYVYSYRYLISAANYSGYKIAYAYDFTTDVGHRRVNRITEYAGSTEGQYVDISYGWNTTTFVDNNSRDEMYQFNNLGEPVCIRNADDSAQYCAFNSADRTQTQIAASSKLQRTTLNLLSNHSFETISSGSTLNDWYNSGTLTFPRSDTLKHSASHSMKVNMSSTSEAGFILQNVGTLTSGSTYTLSGYFYGGSGAQLIVGYRDSSNTWHQQILGEIIAPESGEWMRSYVTFTAVANATYHVGLYIPTATTVTDLYADSFMLEKADALNRYNMITNPDLSGLTGWTTTGTCTTATSSSGYHPAALNNNVIRLKGSGTGTSGECYISQEIVQAGAKGDCYTFGGWMKCDSIPQFEQGGYTYGLRRIRVQFYYSGTWNSGGTVSFNADTSNWQYACGAAVAGANYSKMRILVEYTRNRNYAYVDGIQLFRDEFAQSYTYDSDGNITKVNTLAVKEDTFTYDANDNLTKYTDSNDNETNYTYDSNHNLTKVKSATGLATSFEYDDNGLVTLSATYKDGTSTGQFLASKIAYNNNGMKKTVTDARGNSTSYTYKDYSRLLSTQTNPNNTKATYSYDTRNRLTSVAVLNGSATYGTVSYTYDNYNRRTGITHNGFDYVYTYDGFGNVLTTKVKCGSYTVTLASNEYDYETGTLTRTTLGNGTVVTYNYDNYDRIKNVQIGNTIKYEYTYDNEGNISVIKDNATGISTQYYYDTAGRTSRVVSNDGSHAAYSFTKPGTSTLDVNIRRIEYGYDGSSWGTRYAYDDDNRLTTVTLNNSYTVNYAYHGGTGLLISRTYKNSNSTPGTVFSESFSYVTGDSSIFPMSGGYGGTVKSTLVSSMTSTASGTGTYNYTYDVCGNITSITNSTTGESYSYTYDDQNQLIYESLNFGNLGANTRTVTYTYDNYGNLITKVTRETVSSSKMIITTTKNYSYNNITWKDLLTKYGSDTIVYDNSGNPTSYRGDTMQWSNNQLTQQTHNGSTISYTYNESGLRTKKNVSGGTQTTYVWKDGVLCAMQSGTKVLEFSYSANGDVVSVLIRNQGSGTGTRYYYARNAQGDIIGLVNSSGTMVIRYVYDSWGKLLTTTGTATIGTLNPFRYRGYIYDTETGLYYLKTRYYDPEVGRFINADVLMSTGQGVIGCNMYCYCLNNPVNMADESGCVAMPAQMDDCYPPGLTFNVASINGRCYNVCIMQIILCFTFSNIAIDTDGIVDPEDRKRANDETRSDSTSYHLPGGECLNAFKMPYVVIPKHFGRGMLGSLAVLEDLDSGRRVYAIVGDCSAYNKTVHEVSICAAEMLGLNVTANDAPPGHYRITIYPQTSLKRFGSVGFNQNIQSFGQKLRMEGIIK